MSVADTKMVTNQVGSEKLSRLISLFDMLDWQSRVENVRLAMKLPADAPLNNKNIELPHDSWPYSLGHKTISAFITGDRATANGLGITWAVWEVQSEASRIKSRYSIQSNDPSDILSEYRSVAEALKRAPISSGEYHSVKETLIRSEHSRSLEDVRRQRHALKTKIEGLETQLKEQELVGARAQERASSLLLDLESMKSDFQAQIERQKNEFEGEVARRLSEQSEKLSEEYFSQIKGLTDKITELKSTQTGDLSVSRQDYQALKSHCRSLESSLEEQQRIIDELNASIEEGNKKSQSLIEEAEEKSRIIRASGRAIEALKTRVRELNEFKKSVNEDAQPIRAKAIENELARTQSRISEQNHSIAEIKSKYMHLYSQYGKAVKEVRELRDLSERLKDQRNTLRKNYKKLKDASHTSAILNKVLLFSVAVSVSLLVYFYGF